MSSEQTYNFFFYGTLMVPAVLRRVLKHAGDELVFEDAILPGYTRHCIKGEDYPAVTDTEQSKKLVGDKHQLSEKDLEVRGTLVKGLSMTDVKVIDVFEASEYKRIKVPVNVLGPSTVLNAHSSSQINGHSTVEEAWVYVWDEPVSGLEPKIWSFDDFMRDKAHLWANPEHSGYMAEVDDFHNGASGQPDPKTVEVWGQRVEGYPDFGSNMLKYWRLRKGLTYMNNGSYGATPSPVIESTRKLHDQIESFPDLFMRKSWLPLLNACRSQVAEIINAKYDECIIVKNASMAINTVVNNIRWQDGDVIVIYETTYNAMMQTMKRICDEHPKMNLEIINVQQPCPHSTIVKKTEEVLAKYNEPVGSESSLEVKPKDKMPGQRVKMVVVDSISSNPGIVWPWEAIVNLCHKYGVFSCVDGAHSIGQHKLDVERSKPDFLTTNCHKWMMSHRGSAVFYVPLRNQHLIRTSIPTSAGYESSRYPTKGVEREWEFAKQWEWNGTQDWAPLMSITPAFEFRKSIGGEDRIMGYCHDLAVKGGQRLSERWGTPVMENADPQDGVLTACMVNIATPTIPEPRDAEERFEMSKYFEKHFLGGDVYVPLYKHNGRTWGRFSCQVWNELEDFDKIAVVIERMIEGIKRGDHRNIKVAPTDTLHAVEDVPVQEDMRV